MMINAKPVTIVMAFSAKKTSHFFRQAGETTLNINCLSRTDHHLEAPKKVRGARASLVL
jgi:hypothetical protein